MMLRLFQIAFRCVRFNVAHGHLLFGDDVGRVRAEVWGKEQNVETPRQGPRKGISKILWLARRST